MPKVSYLGSTTTSFGLLLLLIWEKREGITDHQRLQFLQIQCKLAFLITGQDVQLHHWNLTELRISSSIGRRFHFCLCTQTSACQTCSMLQMEGNREGNGALKLPTFLLLVESTPKPRPLAAKHQKLNALWIPWRVIFEPNDLISSLCLNCCTHPCNVVMFWCSMTSLSPE